MPYLQRMARSTLPARSASFNQCLVSCGAFATGGFGACLTRMVSVGQLNSWVQRPTTSDPIRGHRFQEQSSKMIADLYRPWGRAQLDKRKEQYDDLVVSLFGQTAQSVARGFPGAWLRYLTGKLRLKSVVRPGSTLVPILNSDRLARRQDRRKGKGAAFARQRPSGHSSKIGSVLGILKLKRFECLVASCAALHLPQIVSPSAHGKVQGRVGQR